MAVTMTKPGQRLERTVTGPDVAVGAWTLRPAARVSGRQVGASRGAGGGGYWSVRVEPATVTLTGPDGSTTELELPAASGAAIAGMMRVGLLVAVASAVVAILARRR